MEQLKTALEQLDETITDLEVKVGVDAGNREASHKKMEDIIKQSRVREGNVMGTAQKVALRLDQTIEQVEKILKR